MGKSTRPRTRVAPSSLTTWFWIERCAPRRSAALALATIAWRDGFVDRTTPLQPVLETSSSVARRTPVGVDPLALETGAMSAPAVSRCALLASKLRSPYCLSALRSGSAVERAHRTAWRTERYGDVERRRNSRWSELPAVPAFVLLVESGGAAYALSG